MKILVLFIIVMVYTDNRNIIGVYVCLDNLHLQKDLSNNFISYLILIV